MTPTELRNERLAERMIKQLKRRNMEAFYCATAAEAVKKVSELIADGSSVTWGGSMTIRDIGIPQALKGRGTLEVLDRDEVESREEVVHIYERAFTADVYLSSANAISEDGVHSVKAWLEAFKKMKAKIKEEDEPDFIVQDWRS